MYSMITFSLEIWDLWQLHMEGSWRIWHILLPCGYIWSLLTHRSLQPEIPRSWCRDFHRASACLMAWATDSTLISYSANIALDPESKWCRLDKLAFWTNNLSSIFENWVLLALWGTFNVVKRCIQIKWLMSCQ